MGSRGTPWEVVRPGFFIMRQPRGFTAATLALFLLCAQSRATDIWSEPFSGVRYLHRTIENPNRDIHLCLIDLTDLTRMNVLHPRTAVAATKDMKTLILLQVDGRQKHSTGMNVSHMQKLFQEFSAWTALNFDGGGSSLMYMQGPGILNKPSDGRP